MIEVFATEKDQPGVDEFLLSLGRFVISFERVCASMCNVIMFALRSQGLRNQGMEQVIVGGKASNELQNLLGAIYLQLPDQDELDRKAVSKLLNEIKEITEHRNVLLHSSWQFGTGSEGSVVSAIAVKFKPSQKSESTYKIHGYAAKNIDELSQRSEKCQVLLQRLLTCITQSKLKVSLEFSPGKSFVEL